MKKILAMLLALVMVLGLAACGGGNDNSTTSNPGNTAADTPDNTAAPDTTGGESETPAASELEPVTLRMWFEGSNVSPDASAKVMESVNAYLQDKINVTLEPIWGTWGDFDTTTVTALAGGDDVDIYFTCNWSANEYNKYARDGYWVRLDDLLPTYGADLLTTIPQLIWDCAQTNGYDGMGVYAVPGLKDTATQYCWDVNGTLLAELGYDVDEVCANGLDFYSDEFEAMLKAAKDAKGSNFYPLLMEAIVLERIADLTPTISGDLPNSYVLSFYHDAEHPGKDIGSTLVNKYSTPEFKKFVERIYYLSQQGYVAPSSQSEATANDYRTATSNSGDYLFNTLSYAFGCELDYSVARGIDVRAVPVSAPYMDATSGQGAMMAISATSKNPERALMFLNLLNTDPTLMTLMNYGTEGFTYNKNTDGTISFIQENRANYSPWTMGMGNVRILPPTDAQGADFWDRFTAYYDSAEKLPLGGFVFDSSAYEKEAAAIANVYAEYGFNLMSGAVDPATALPEFLAKLESAGVDKIVAGAQEQLNAYLG